MGAGDCPQETEVQLLRQVLKLDLGFPEFQLQRAIHHLVKEFGSSEEALAWIPQDNFTILVSYILDNDTDIDCQKPRSPVGIEETKTTGTLPTANASGGGKQIEAGRKGGKPLAKAAVKKESLNGYVSGGNAPLKVAQSHGKFEKRNNTSPPQRGLVDRNELRNHCKKKLWTGLNAVSTDFQVNEALKSQAEHSNSGNSLGQSIPNKRFKRSLEQAEQLIPKAATNSTAKSRDQKIKEKRESELHCSIKAPYSAQKKGRCLEPEANKELFWEASPLVPSACRDLATGSGSTQVVKNKNADCTFIRDQSFVAAHDDQSKTVRQQCGEIKAAIDGYSAAAKEKAHHFCDLEETPGTSNRLKSMNSNTTARETETCKVETCSLGNYRQKQSHSVQDGCSVRGEQDHASNDGNKSFPAQLEGFLKEGNCQMALETFKAWKQNRNQVETWDVEKNHLEGRGHDVVADIPGKRRGFVVSYDISRGLERFPITCVNEYNPRILPENFLYVTKSVIRQAAHVDVSFSRIGDLHCCCSDDCLRSSEACKCTDSTRGEYAYDKNGQLIERLALSFQSGCNTSNGDFITECCDKCRCSMSCGNRIVQRGITRKLQVFMTPTNKGWGVRALEKIPARSFVCEYLGEIATNAEQIVRNSEYEKNGVYTYTMALDADFDMEKCHFKEGLNDFEALVLDATIFGNVSRFVNHRCNDANLFMRPVQVETRDTHYYHAAFFAERDIQEMEELTWDYGIDFQDDTHLVKAFRCRCKSAFCRDKESTVNSKERLKRGKTVKGSDLKRGVSQNERRS